MPALNLFRLFDDGFQSRLADQGIGIDQKRRDGRYVQRLHQSVAHRFADILAARDGGKRLLHLAAGDDFDQIGVGQKR